MVHRGASGDGSARAVGAWRLMPTFFVYALALLASNIALGTVVAWALLTEAALPQTLSLPIGLPWVGAHLRLDPLAAAA